MKNFENIVEDIRPTLKRQRFTKLEVPERRQEIGKAFVCIPNLLGQQKEFSPIEVGNVVDVCAGGVHSLLLTDNGDVYSFGLNDEGALGRDTRGTDVDVVPEQVQLPDKAVRISAGHRHSACLLRNGLVYAWGSFRDSGGNMGLTMEGIQRKPINLLDGVKCVDLASGVGHLVMLTELGEVYTVGCAEQGQLGRIADRYLSGDGRRGKQDLLTPKKIVIKNAKPFYAIWVTAFGTYLRESQTHTIWAMGQIVCNSQIDRLLAPMKTYLKDVKHISGGNPHTLLLDDHLRCFVVGCNDNKSNGLAEQKALTNLTLIPLKLFDDSNLICVSCGQAFSYAVNENGKLYMWYAEKNKENWEELKPSPVDSVNLLNKRVLMISGGDQYSICLVDFDHQADKEVLDAQQPEKKPSDTAKPTAKERAEDTELEKSDGENALTQEPVEEKSNGQETAVKKPEEKSDDKKAVVKEPDEETKLQTSIVKDKETPKQSCGGI